MGNMMCECYTSGLATGHGRGASSTSKQMATATEMPASTNAMPLRTRNVEVQAEWQQQCDGNSTDARAPVLILRNLVIHCAA